MSNRTNLTKIKQKGELLKLNPNTTLPLIVATFFSVVLVIYILVFIFLCGTWALRKMPKKEEPGPEARTVIQMVDLDPSSYPPHCRNPDNPGDNQVNRRQTYFARFVRDADDEPANGQRDNDDEPHKRCDHTCASARIYNEFQSHGLNILTNPRAVYSHSCNTSSTGSRNQSSGSVSFANLPPYPHPGFGDSGKFHRTMGLKKLDLPNWLNCDWDYTSYHKVRTELLDYRKEEVLQYTLDAEKACEELLGLVSEFLAKRYPEQFSIKQKKNGQKMIFNNVTFEHFSLEPNHEGIDALEICARLAMEDFNILMKNKDSGEHHLVASATLFPVGWRLPSRFGNTISQIHRSVPSWTSRLSNPIEHYFSRLSPASCMERHAYFIQIILKPQEMISVPSLFIQEGSDFLPSERFGVEDVIIRRERQTFRRLKKSGAVVFTVKTRMVPLVQLRDEDYTGLACEIRSWPEEVAKYKGRHIWEDIVLQYCDSRSDK